MKYKIAITTLIIILITAQTVSALTKDPEKFYIWLSSDPHTGNAEDNTYKYVMTSLNDTLDFFPVWEVGIINGDVTEDGDYIDWSKYIEQLNHTFNAPNRTTPQVRESIYTVAGNHDQEISSVFSYWNWVNYSDPLGTNSSTSFINNSRRPYNISNATSPLYYEVIIENITCRTNLVLLMISVDLNDTNEFSTNYYPDGAYDWWVKRVENHTNDIILTFTHHELENSSLWAKGDGKQMLDVYSNQFEGYLNNPLHNKSVDFWASAHWHWRLAGYNPPHSMAYPKLVNATYPNNNSKYLNTTFLNLASIKGVEYWGTHSYLLEFNNNTKAVQLYEYSHGNNTWTEDEVASDQIYTGNTTIFMHKDFTIWRDLNDVPNATAVYPLNNSVNLSIDNLTHLNFTLNDHEGQVMNYTYGYLLEGCNISGTNISSLPNGTYSLNVSPGCLPLNYNTNYTWWINVTDDTDYKNYTFTFSTKNVYPLKFICDVSPEMTNLNKSGNTVIALTLTLVLISAIMLIFVYIKGKNII